MGKPLELVLGRKGHIVQGPVLSGTVLVAAAGQVAGHGRVSCWELTGLGELWSVENDGFLPLEAVRDVFVCSGGEWGKGARDMRTGQILWSSPEHASMVSSSWNDYVVSLDGGRQNVDLLESRTGRLAGRISVAGNRGSALRVSGDRAFVDIRYVRCLSLARGDLAWGRDLASEISAAPGVGPAGSESPYLQYSSGSLPDVMVGYFGNSTVAFSALDGAMLWVTPETRGWTGLRVFEGRIYGMRAREFWAIDERTGEVVIRRSCPQELSDELFIRATPAVRYRNRIAIPHETGLLAIFDADDGALVGHYRAKHALWNAVEAGGRLFVGTGSGRILVFEESIWAL